MALRITDDCIHCGACEVECPNGAIYEGGNEWKFSDATNLTGIVKDLKGNLIDTDKANEPIQNEIYYVVEDKCTECLNYADEPQCIAVCCVESYEKAQLETKEELYKKIEWMFGENHHYENNYLSVFKTTEIDKEKIDNNSSNEKNGLEIEDKVQDKISLWRKLFG